jgi:glucose-1-phosphate thymidylyltransferase
MKGVILAGGAGTRLYPLTRVASKQLQAVYDKPMVYYPLTTLMENGIRQFCLISSPADLPRYEQLFGDGGQWGISIEYREQPEPKGIAQALIIADTFIGDDTVALILGDNIFHGPGILRRTFLDFSEGAQVFACRVSQPEQYGVIEFDDEGRAVSIEEKPSRPRSHFAVPGLYLYDREVAAMAGALQPSARGELEITHLNEQYLEQGRLRVKQLPRGFAWLDSGTSQSLHEGAAFVQTLEKRQGIKVGCPEEAALRQGYLQPVAFEKLVSEMPACEYRQYLEHVLKEEK